MEAKLITVQENAKIVWDDGNRGFGEITFTWDSQTSRYIVDTELLGIDTVIEIIKLIK